MILALIAVQSTPPPAPPSPPLPKSGQIECVLKSERGESGTVVGKLDVSEPRYQGKRFPTLKVEGTGAFPSGEYDASWTIDGGHFVFEEKGTRALFDFRLVSQTYKSGRGAMAVKVWDGSAPPRYFAGFCNLDIQL